jgi:hypothetical protein
VGFLEGASDGQTLSAPFDYVWETVAVDRADPCAGFTQPVR